MPQAVSDFARWRLIGRSPSLPSPASGGGMRKRDGARPPVAFGGGLPHGFAMEQQDILVARQGGVATITLNRPAKRNAVRLAMWRRLGDLFEEHGESAETRVIVLTGTGGHFCAGADISEFGEVRDNAKAAEDYEHAGTRAMLAIRDCPKPVIAQISGSCVGGGLGLALACDFRIADRTARLGIPAARLGIIYGVLDCQLLVNAAGPVNAKRVLMTAMLFPAAEAATMGLVDVLAEDSAAATRDFVRTLVDNAPLSIAGAKLVVNAVASDQVAAKTAEIDRVITRAMDSEDYQEGRKAFGEKRAPVFRGR
jgi:enoyl-CoA hydratase/carnithine racemase